MANHPRWADYRYLGADDVLLNLGRRYDAKETPFELQEGEPNSCYDNALRLAMEEPDRYTYVEGYAYNAKVIFPIWHAWVLDVRDGKAVDNTPTWPDPLDSAYWGLAMPLHVVQIAALRTGHSGVFESDWKADFYFVREGWRDCVDSSLA